MIHQIVEDALKCIDAYKIDRRVERYQIVTMTDRVAQNKGTNEAMTLLNAHLDKHYDLRTVTPAMCYVGEKK